MAETGIGDEKVVAATGKGLGEWFALLDQAGAKEWAHKQMADWLWENHLKKGWWCQMVVVEYERARGLRQLHERPDGYQVSVSKTFNKSVGEIYEKLKNIDHAEWTTDRENAALRGKYFDTRLEVSFYQKDDKTQVVIQQSRIKSSADVDRMKARWKKHLESLA